MAEKDYQLKITVDTSGAIQGIDGLTDAMKDAEKEIPTVEEQIQALQKTLNTFDPKTKEWQNAAREFQNLGGNASKLKSGLKDLQQQLATTDPKTEGWSELNATYIELGGSVSELTDLRLSSLKEQLDGLDPQSEKWKTVNEEFTQLGGKIEPIVEPVKSLKTQIRELTLQLTSGKLKEGSAEFEATKLKIQELKDAAGDLNEELAAGTGNAVETSKGNFALLRERLFNLDFEGVGQSVKGFASTIKNFSFKTITDGIKGVIGGLRALGAAAMANPVIAILAGIALAITGVVLLFNKMQDNARENTAKLNAEVDKQAEYRKQQEKKQLAQVGSDAKKQYELKRQFAQNEINDTKKKLDNLERQQKQGYSLSEDQEKELDTLRKQYSQQRVDYEIMAIERMNALNQARVDLDRKFNQIGMNERQKANNELELAYQDEKKRLEGLGASQADIAKNDAVFAEQKRLLNANFAKQDASEAKSRSDQRKSEREEATNDLNS